MLILHYRTPRPLDVTALGYHVELPRQRGDFTQGHEKYMTVHGRMIYTLIIKNLLNLKCLLELHVFNAVLPSRALYDSGVSRLRHN